jgi:hypothetical protein
LGNELFFQVSLSCIVSEIFMNGARGGDFRAEKINHYAIHLPSGYVLLDVAPQMADFGLFEVVNKENRSDKMVLYFGNHPHFPGYDWKEPPSESVGAEVKKTFYSY